MAQDPAPNGSPPNGSDPNGSDRFATISALLLAVVALLGAFVAWRISIADDNSNDTDFLGITATINLEDSRLVSTATHLQHYRLYTQFVRNDELGYQLIEDVEAATERAEEADAQQDALDETEDTEEAAELAAEIAEADALASQLGKEAQEADDLSAHAREFFPSRYLNRDDTYNVTRELSEAEARAAQEEDLDPDRHFVAAEAQRQRSFQLTQVLVVLAVALFFFMIIEAVQSRVKYAFFALGTIALLVSLAATYLVEVRA